MTCIKCEEARRRMLALYDRVAATVRQKETNKRERSTQDGRNIMVDCERSAFDPRDSDRIL